MKQRSAKSLTTPLILLSVLVFAITVGFFVVNNCQLPKQVNQTSSFNQTKNWKTYLNSQFTFKYPQNWYTEKFNEEVKGLSENFFLQGSRADHSFGDHIGNEVMKLNYGEAAYSFDYLKDNFYPNATNLTVGGNQAFRTQNKISIFVGPSENNILTLKFTDNSKNHIDQILSTFQFLD